MTSELQIEYKEFVSAIEDVMVESCDVYYDRLINGNPSYSTVSIEEYNTKLNDNLVQVIYSADIEESLRLVNIMIMDLVGYRMRLRKKLGRGN